MKGIMKGLQTASFRGSTKRADAIDETDRNWKQKAGRVAGPDTYVPGDYCASVLSQVSKMTPRDRNLLYGGPVLLVGLVEADGLISMDTNGLSDPYVTIVPLDAEGGEHDKEKNISRTIMETLTPQWDELYCCGQKVDVDDIHTLRFKVKDYDTPMKSDRLGQVDLDVSEVKANANGEVWDIWLDIEKTADMEQHGPLGRLHLQLLYHGPLPDPQPISVGIRVMHARELLVADRSGFSDPYVILSPVSRKGQPVLDSKGKKVEARTTIKNQTLNPDWNEAFVFGDACLGETGVAGTEEWGWEGGQDVDLSKAKTTIVTGVHLEKSHGLEFLLYDQDFGKADDPLGVMTLPYSALFGDDETVICGTALRNDKIYPVKWMKGIDKKAKLGFIRLDIVLRFADNLAPEGWVAAVDNASGNQYYWNSKRAKAQWHEPAAYRHPDAVEEEDESSEAGASGSAGHVASERAHKPPRPVGDAPASSGSTHTLPTSPTAAKPTAAPAPQKKEEKAAVSKPAAAPSPSPAPAPSSAGKASEDDDGDAEETAPADAAAIEQYAAMSFGGGKARETVISGGVDVDLSSLAGAAGQSEREKAFFETMKKNAEEKKKSEQAALKAKLSAMTPEEREEWEKEQEAEKKRAARREKMAGQLASSYGNSTARLVSARGLGAKGARGRGRGR